MKQYEVLTAKKLFHGSDIVRKFTYKAVIARDNYALLRETDCFVCCSPCGGIIGSRKVLWQIDDRISQLCCGMDLRPRQVPCTDKTVCARYFLCPKTDDVSASARPVPGRTRNRGSIDPQTGG